VAHALPSQSAGTMKRTLVVTLLAAALCTFAAGCNNDPGKDKTKAQVGEAVAVTSAAVKGGVPYAFSSADSKLTFVGAKVTGKHDGSFGTFSGTVDLVDGKPEKSNVTVEVDMASVSADDPKLTGHLKSPDFFDVAKFPKARFVSTAIEPSTEKGATHKITGNLEFHGVTKSIAFPANVRVEGDKVSVDAEFVLNRKDFGVVYAGQADNLIKDEVALKFAVVAKKKG
jgi:polyisoprenoid-binding protein YceI